MSFVSVPDMEVANQKVAVFLEWMEAHGDASVDSEEEIVFQFVGSYV
jgi:hypothetical protein